jgi:hypothetical protein
MRTPELEKRHRASAVVSKLMLICCHSMLEGYDKGGRNIAACHPEMMVIMAIRINDDRRCPPISANRIAKVIRLPRQNVDRWLATLIKHRVIKKSGNGYIGDDTYIGDRLRARYFLRMVRAIRAAARALEGFNTLLILSMPILSNADDLFSSL